jgi:hypothetical protein
LSLLVKLKGTPAALQRYDELKKQPHAVDEFKLNALGYQLRYGGMAQDGFITSCLPPPRSRLVRPKAEESGSHLFPTDLSDA